MIPKVIIIYYEKWQYFKLIGGSYICCFLHCSCGENDQWTGFYMKIALIFNGLTNIAFKNNLQERLKDQLELGSVTLLVAKTLR